MTRMTNNDDTYCRKCGSGRLTFRKFLHNGPVQGTSYHYRAYCGDCRFSYHVARTKHVYEQVKDQPWCTKKRRRNV